MKIFKYVFALILVITLASCSDDDTPEPVNEEEVITTLTATLTATDAATVTLQIRDLDGDGPDAPVISSPNVLLPNTTYQGRIELLNETESPAEDITEEVEEEDEEHQLFFSTTGNITSVTYNDTDGNGNPVGLSFTVTTGDAGSGTITITLRHEPNKTADGVSDGDITNAGGETDITVTFDITIQG